MARPLDEILKDYENLYISQENCPRVLPKDFVRACFPKILQQENNDPFFEFVDKLFSFEQKIEFWAWILETQFSVYTAKGKFLDNLGRWLGLSRPPLPILRTTKPVVIFPPKSEDTDMTPEELLEFNTLHGLTGWDGEGVKDTFFPSKDFIGEVLVNDDEYRTYILCMLQLKKGLSLDSILNIVAHILIKPFFITKHNAEVLEITASYYEDSVRLVIMRELTARLRTTGFNIQVIQALEPKPKDIALKYGDDCWDQPNPYIDNIWE